MDLRKGNATLSNRSAKLESDFILLISPKERIGNTRAFMEPHPDCNNHSAVMVTLSPQDFTRSSNSIECSKSEIIFVVDCSGSMEDKVNDLRTAMKVAIRSLPEGCFFNLCLFGSSNELLWDKSRPATQENSDEAFTRSAHLAASMGGTERNSALKRAVTCRASNLDTNIIVVTDGETWNMEEVHAFVRKTNKEHGVRFFCLGIGNAISHSLVEGIGRQGGGLSEVVTLADSGRWEARVIGLLKGALTPTSWRIKLHPGPVVEDLKNDYSSLQTRESTIFNFRAPACIQAPFHIPKLHTCSRSSVFLLVNNRAFEDAGRKIHIVAESSNGETFDHVLHSERLESTPSAVHCLATYVAVKDLENKTSWLHNIQHEALHKNNDYFQSIVKQEAEWLEKTWSIVGKWTSFIAIEKSGHNAHVRNLAHIYRAEALPLQDASRMHKFPTRRMIQGSAEQETVASGVRLEAPIGRWGGRSGSRRHLIRTSHNALIFPPSTDSTDMYAGSGVINRNGSAVLRSESENMAMGSLERRNAGIQSASGIPKKITKAFKRSWQKFGRSLKGKKRNKKWEDDERGSFTPSVSASATTSQGAAGNHTIFNQEFGLPQSESPASISRRSPSLHESAQEIVDDMPSSGISVEYLISAQLATGCFAFQQTSLDALLSAFDENVAQQVETKLATKSSGTTKEPLLPTILALVYIEMQFQEQLQLLELVIYKAKRWLEKAIHGETKDIFETARSGFLDNSI